MAADEKKLGALHEKVAEVLIHLLEGVEIPTGEVDPETGETQMHKMEPSAAIIAAATKFLKDNSITCAPSKDNALGAMQEQLAERQKKRASRLDLRQAAIEQASRTNFLSGLPDDERPH